MRTSKPESFVNARGEVVMTFRVFQALDPEAVARGRR